MESLNQIALCQATWGEVFLVSSQVFRELKTGLYLSIFDFQRGTSAILEGGFVCWAARVSYISFRIPRRWWRLLWASTDATEALSEIPISITPLAQVKSNKQPLSDQMSYQKEFVLLFLMSIHIKILAISRYFRMFRHIQEPEVVISLTEQKVPCLINSLHPKRWISWSNPLYQLQTTPLLSSFRGRRSDPPSLLGLKTSSQAILAFHGFNSEFNHKKSEQSLFISCKHSLFHVNTPSEVWTPITNNLKCYLSRN